MTRGEANVNRLDVGWGDSLMNKLPSRSRKRRKRLASKVRRMELKRRMRRDCE